MPRVIVCDVNETLLDIGALGPYFEETFGDRRVLQEWFQTVLLYSEVVTIAGPYASFSRIGAAALEMTAHARGITLTTAGRDRILQGMLTLPPHPDVRAGLQAMRDAGLRLVTLTNNPPASVQQQLAHTGLGSFFDRSFPWTRSSASSQQPIPIDPSRKPWMFRWTDCGSSRRMHGMCWARCVRAAPPRSSHGRARCCFRLGHSRTSSGPTSVRWQDRLWMRKRRY